MAVIDWTIRYLFRTRYLGIMYTGKLLETLLVIISDILFADDLEIRRLSQGYTILLFEGLITWRATRQAIVTTSITKAELLGMEHIEKEAIALYRLFCKI
jgi:hypothetical protein